MLLLRTTAFKPGTQAFAKNLARESGHKVCLLIDERKGEVDAPGFDKIGLTEQACGDLGLYCPVDFAWRCGDYGFYLARARFPEERFIWMIEDDVRIAKSIEQFFRHFANADSHDLIAGHYRQALKNWRWSHTMVSHNKPVWQCFFPVIRLSAAAIDFALSERRKLAFSFSRRADWPNDEGFIASALTRGGMNCADLNNFGASLYQDSTYSFDRLIRGEEVGRYDATLQLLHPVLFGDDFERKARRLTIGSPPEGFYPRVRRKALRLLNRLQ